MKTFTTFACCFFAVWAIACGAEGIPPEAQSDEYLPKITEYPDITEPRLYRSCQIQAFLTLNKIRDGDDPMPGFKRFWEWCLAEGYGTTPYEELIVQFNHGGFDAPCADVEPMPSEEKMARNGDAYWATCFKAAGKIERVEGYEIDIVDGDPQHGISGTRTKYSLIGTAECVKDDNQAYLPGDSATETFQFISAKVNVPRSGSSSGPSGYSEWEHKEFVISGWCGEDDYVPGEEGEHTY